MVCLAVTSQDTFLSPLNKENIGLSEVIFLPAPAARRSRQTDIPHPQHDHQIQYSSQEDQIRSRENMQGSDIIDPLYSNSYQAEDYNHHVMTGSYAYVSDGFPRVIHWTMLSDGRFEFSASQEMTSDQYDVLSHYYQDGDTTTQPPVTESHPYDPYDEMFAVSGYD